MNKFSTWEEQDNVKITTIDLDSRNPRIPALGHQATQREILAELIAHEKVYELANEIASQGFFPTETLICVQESGRLIAVEGNRRLAGLKLLLSPDSAPPEYVGRFRALARKLGDSPSEVRIVIAPSRTAAAPLIMRRHTRSVVKSWEPIQQARYVNSLRSDDMSTEQLAELTGFTKSELLKILRTYTMYEIATRLKLQPEAEIVVSDPRRFNTSTLERIIDRPKVRDFLGISFDENGRLIGKSNRADFTKLYTRIVEDIALGNIDTRALNKAVHVDSYVVKLGSVLGSKKLRQGSFTSDDFIRDDADESDHKGRPKTRRARNKELYLVPRSFKCELRMPRISQILYELQHLRIRDFENGVAALLRVFIELSTSHYLESTGKMKPLVARLDKGDKRPKTWTPSFRQMLNELLQNDTSIDIPRQARRALSRAVSDDEHPLSLDGMDQFIHNPYMAPTERQLRQFWNVFEDLAGFLMVEHTVRKDARKR